MLRFGLSTARFASIHVLLWITLSVHFFATASDASAQTPSVSATPRLLDFGPVAVGAQEAKSVMLTNTGAVTRSGTIALDGDAAFSLAEPGAFELSAGASRTIEVVYAPTGAEQVAGTVVIEVGDEVQRVPLYGGALYHPAARGDRALDTLQFVWGDGESYRGSPIGAMVHNTGYLQGWLADGSFFGDALFAVAAEVRDDAGALVRLLSTPRGSGTMGTPTEPGNPANAWTFEPVPGFAAASAHFAVSTDATTWPSVWPDKRGDASDPGWPGAWNGLLGKDAFIDGMETYAVVADNHVGGFDYTPDPADPSRRGLGLVVEQRVLIWRHPALRRAVFLAYDVWNASPRDLDTVRLLFRFNPVMGGHGDSEDDAVWYDVEEDFLITFDYDNSGSFRQPVPRLTTLFLDSPQRASASEPLGLTGLTISRPVGNLPLSSEDAIWELTAPGAYTSYDWLEQFNGEGGVNFNAYLASGDFSLPTYQRERPILAWVLSDDEDFVRPNPWLAEGAVLARSFQRNGFVMPEIVEVDALAPMPGEENLYLVSWTPPTGMDRVHLAYTSDFGQTWTDIGWGLPNSGTATWGTADLDQGVYQIRVTAYSDEQVASGLSAVVRIDSDGNAPPVVAFSTPLPSRLEGTVPVTWTADDPEGEAVTVALDYALDGYEPPGFTIEPTWIELAEGLAQNGTYQWDTTLFPNGTAYRLRVRAQAGDNEVEVRTRTLTVANPRLDLAEDARGVYEGVGRPIVSVHVVDEAALTGHRYRTDFSVVGPLADELTTYSVTDEDTGTSVVTEANLPEPNTEGPLFDGMRLLIANPPASPDYAASGFDLPSQADSLAVFVNDLVDPFTGARREAVRLPLDFEVEFTETAVSTSTELEVGLLSFPSVPARFRVRNTTDDEPMPFAFIDQNGSETLDQTTESILLLAEVDGGWRPSYQLFLSRTTDRPPVPPSAGDRYRLITRKPIRDGDTFAFEARVAVDVEDQTVPTAFALHGAYPNPFTEAVTLTLDLDRAQDVRLVMFDVLGREVRVLADGAHAPGRHTVRVDGTGLSSGVYFVRLEGERQQATRKLLHVR